MNDPQPPQPPQFDAKDTALESELSQLHPAAMPPDLRETTLGTLAPSLSVSERSLEGDLGSLRAKSVDSRLWERLEARLEDEAPSNVVSMPRWRDFAPVFKVAAVVAVGLFAAWSIKTDISQESVEPTASTVSELSGQMTPVSRSGTIQGTRRVGFMERDKRVYERQLQTRQDRSHYRFDKDLRVEDEVTRQRQVISPVVTY